MRLVVRVLARILHTTATQSLSTLDSREPSEGMQVIVLVTQLEA